MAKDSKKNSEKNLVDAQRLSLALKPCLESALFCSLVASVRLNLPLKLTCLTSKRSKYLVRF